MDLPLIVDVDIVNRRNAYLAAYRYNRITSDINEISKMLCKMGGGNGCEKLNSLLNCVCFISGV